MDASRSSTPEQPPQDLWSSILDSVSSTRSIPSKQVILLGEPSSGKSTIASTLLQKLGDVKEGKNGFAMGYDWADIKDDADEDTLARLSVYSVPSSSQSHLSLLPHFIPLRSSLQHTVVMMILDWTRPWTFIEKLETWLTWVEKWSKGDGSRECQIAGEEGRERLQSYLQHYSEPNTDPVPPSSSLNSTLLPLGTGILTHNSCGVPLIVVCSKADLIDEGNDPVGGGVSGMGGMVKGKGGEWEEQSDSIMQVLRTICLKYGAALFYTTLLPHTLLQLRQYTLHLLFASSAPSPGIPLATDMPVPFRNPFLLAQKPNVLDRDRIFVPAGWDSWGKIAVLRDGFDAKTWGEAWETDMEYTKDSDSEQGQSSQSAKKLFAELAPDRGDKPHPLPPFNNPMPEQAFLAKNYDENSKKPDRDPRGAFRNPGEGIGSGTAGIVGPLSSSSFSLPNVERALVEMEGGVNNGLNASMERKGPRRDVPGRLTNTLSATGQATSPTSHGHTRPASTSPLSANPPSGQSQHEVLHNFFQSLLSSRERGAASSVSSRPAGNVNDSGNHDDGGYIADANGVGNSSD